MRTFSAKRGGSNLKAKRKRLSIVFATLFAAKQGVCRAECTEATADDYATVAGCVSSCGMDKRHTSLQPKKIP